MRRRRKLRTGVGIALLAAALGGEARAQGDAAEDRRIAEGRRLYDRYGSACHGVKGEGDGPVAETLNVPPANLQSIQR